MLKNTLKKQTEIKQTALRFIAAFLVFAWFGRTCPCRKQQNLHGKTVYFI